MKAMLIVVLALVAAAPVVAQTDPVTPSAATSADPARIAAAERAVAALVPKGTHLRMMRDQMPKMMDAMVTRLMGMNAKELGVPDKDGSGASLADSARKADPAFEERMKITMRVMFDEFGTIFDAMEPRIRAGLSHAFARKCNQTQRNEMNAFFMTPSRSAFAREYLSTFVDPELMQEMVSLTPEIMKAMPKITEKVADATKHLPPLPKPKDDA